MRSLKEIKDYIVKTITESTSTAKKFEQMGYAEGKKDIDLGQWSDIVSGMKALYDQPKTQLEAIGYAKGYFYAKEEQIALKRQELDRLQEELNHEIDKFDAFVAKKYPNPKY